MEIQNKKAKAIIDALSDARADFLENKRGQDWRAMVMSVAYNYAADRVAIIKKWRS